MQRKPDDEAISAFFAELSRAPWLYARQREWPRFFFHVTDASNVVSILRDRELLCREVAQATGRMQNDNASAEVLDGTHPAHFEAVRLYFRPRTPTFWHNEGICPQGRCTNYRAHCPMPVALLFDAAEVAGLAGVTFSSGNLAGSATRVGSDLEFLRSLNFAEIYHDQPPPTAEKARIQAARQAEIAVPDGLPLTALRRIASRSHAERQTLRTMLDDAGVLSPVVADAFVADYRCFIGHRTYVERVAHDGERLIVAFNQPTETPGPYTADLVVTRVDSGETPTKSFSIRADATLRCGLPRQFWHQTLRIDLYLDRYRAFSGVLNPVPSMSLLS
jgi:hypothetical protein